ncbi:MAG: hypothetical protein ACYC5Q_03440 [Thermoleophilia bacterium]
MSDHDDVELFTLDVKLVSLTVLGPRDENLTLEKHITLVDHQTPGKGHPAASRRPTMLGIGTRGRHVDHVETLELPPDPKVQIAASQTAVDWADSGGVTHYPHARLRPSGVR